MLRSIKLVKFLAVLIVVMFFVSSIPMIDARNIPNGFDGVSWKPVVPIKKITFVNFDEKGYLDDFAYLAAIPASVFYDKDGNRIFSHPLLYYQDPYPVKEDKERSLNARQGIDYFMEDWMDYCDGRLDKMILINVPKSKIPAKWSASNYTSIESDNPYEIAAKIALHDWSYSDKAVVSVIDETFEKTRNTIYKGKFGGTLSTSKGIKTEHFTVEQTNLLNPVYGEFTVDEGYKYVKAETWWDCIVIGGLLAIPAGDPDMQLYCKYDDKWMQVSAAQNWNILQGPYEHSESYVYKSGRWRVGITDFPTEGNIPKQEFFGGMLAIHGSLLKILPPVVYNIDITMYPGVEFKIPEKPPFGCRDVDFRLTWDNLDVSLGFSIIGPGGEEIISAVNESRHDSQEMHLDQLGECLDDESYSVCVFTLSNISSPVDFEIEYSWNQNISKFEGDCLSSATEGAILASALNAPLLYTSPSNLPDETRNALYTLGVKNIHLVNLGSHLSSRVKKEINDVAKIKENYKEYEQIYDAIRKITGRNDAIFTTIDPWSYWLVEELMPTGEMPGALFIGPAAYIAAHHGSPVLIVDNHPRLSSSIVYHNEFWKHHAGERFDFKPSIAEMYLTGKRVYDFLKEYEFDEEGMESIITIAGQYDIGISWDRIFPGAAKPGRFFGSPVDVAYWISRSVFYPAMIFVNPALDPSGVELINGSKSERKPIFGSLGKPIGNTLKITRPSEKEVFKYPVLHVPVTHQHRFNERASKYYGSEYECADGIIPGKTSSFNPIDQGSCKKYMGKEGAYWPDMTESEIPAFYLEKGGYSNCFSTNFSITMENFNKGVILVLGTTHGEEHDAGTLEFWDPDKGFESHLGGAFLKPFVGATKEENPWRGYEWFLGSTEEPDTMSMDMIFKTGYDWLPARKPIREFLNKIIPFIDPFEVEDLYDGVALTVYFSRYPVAKYNGYDLDKALENIHSAGYITTACQTSNTYMHLSLIRHGSVFQVIDPWTTSWYGAVWLQTIPRDIILGYTIGEAYVRGMSHVGILYISDPPQWWWDLCENVCLFGDPDLRVWVPGTEYSDKNHWNEPESLVYAKDLSINGHMPFGATEYPHKITPFPWLMVIGIVLIVAVAGIVAFLIIRRKS